MNVSLLGVSVDPMVSISTKAPAAPAAAVSRGGGGPRDPAQGHGAAGADATALRPRTEPERADALCRSLPRRLARCLAGAWPVAGLVAGVLALTGPAAADCRVTLPFGFGSAGIARGDRLLPDALAARCPAAEFALTAHAESDGSGAGNRRIAEARAAAVAEYLGRPRALRIELP